MNQQAVPAIIDDLDTQADLQYRAAWLQGELDSSRRLILDNRVRNGRPGYEILEAITIAGFEQKILVNRGWVPASVDRAIFPEIEAIQGRVQLRGYLYQSLDGYRLDDGIGLVADWPARVGWVSADRANSLFGEAFFPTNCVSIKTVRRLFKPVGLRYRYSRQAHRLRRTMVCHGDSADSDDSDCELQFGGMVCTDPDDPESYTGKVTMTEQTELTSRQRQFQYQIWLMLIIVFGVIAAGFLMVPKTRKSVWL